MRAYIPLVLLVTALASCGSNGDNGGAPAAGDRIERCVDRLLQRSAAPAVNEEDARRYVRNTYCARFQRNGWVYEDGALSIAAHEWLENAATCAAGSEGEPTHTVPCEEERRARRPRIDCALLHSVRRREVRDYLEKLQRDGAVECDDTTPLDELGVP